MVYILDRKRVKDKISYDFIKNFINIRYQRKSIFPEWFQIKIDFGLRNITEIFICSEYL